MRWRSGEDEADQRQSPLEEVFDQLLANFILP